MRLKEFIQAKGLTVKAVADKLSIPVTSLRSYASGDYKPLADRAVAIKKFSRGLVTEFDAIIKASRLQKNIDWEKKREVSKQKRQGSEKRRSKCLPVPELSTPLSHALFIMNGKAIYLKCRGEFRLYGAPVKAKQIIMAANSILQSLGRRPIAYPGLDIPPRYNIASTSKTISDL